MATLDERLEDIFKIRVPGMNPNPANPANSQTRNPSGWRLLVGILVVSTIFYALPSNARGYFIILLALGGAAGISNTPGGINGFLGALKGEEN